MTRLVVDTPSAPAWEPGDAVEVRLLAPSIIWTVTGTLEGRGETDPIREALAHVEQALEWHVNGTRPTGQSVELRAAISLLRSAPDPVSETAEAPDWEWIGDRLGVLRSREARR